LADLNVLTLWIMFFCDNLRALSGSWWQTGSRQLTLQTACEAVLLLFAL